MKTVKYRIPNITCGHCVHTIKMEIGELEGVISVKADVNEKTAEISYDLPATEQTIKQTLAEINYPAED